MAHRGEGEQVPGAPPDAARPLDSKVVTAARPPSTVLIADPDPVSRRFVEIAVGRKQDLRVETTSDGAGALEILGAHRVQLVLAETDLPDMNGLQLFRRLIQETRLRGTPFVFLSADGRPTTRRTAFAAGADDFMVKPCDGDVLEARVRSLIAREQRAAADRQARASALAGHLAELSFAELLAILEPGRRSGVISVACSDAMGTAYLDGGRVVHAVFGNLSGPAAFTELLAETDGHFEFTPGPCPVDGQQRSINDPAQAALIREAAAAERRGVTAEYFALPAGQADGDVAGPDVPGPLRAPAAAAESAVAEPPPSIPVPALAPPFIPDAGAAAQIERAIKDGFTLGDLMSFTDEDLARWTAGTPARDRFHVLLIADLPQGVSAMLTLAGAPTEDWILRSLSPRLKAVGLGFFLRRERLLDVVLADIREPAQLSGSLLRVPSVVVVAPPAAHPQAVGVRARVDLGDLLRRLSPPAVLILGDPMLKKALRSPGNGSGRETAIRCLPTVLGEPGADLRAVLAEGIRLCADSASAG